MCYCFFIITFDAEMLKKFFTNNATQLWCMASLDYLWQNVTVERRRS